MEIDTYQGSILVNHHLLNFLRYLFKYQPWQEEKTFSWMENDRKRTLDIFVEDPEVEIKRPTIFINFPEFPNTLISFNAEEGQESMDTEKIVRVYNVPYSITFRVLSFSKHDTASLLDMLFIVLIHPQFCSAFEKVTNIRPDIRENNFRRNSISRRPSTGVAGGSGSFEYEGSITGEYLVMMKTEFTVTSDAGTIAKEFIEFERET